MRIPTMDDVDTSLKWRRKIKGQYTCGSVRCGVVHDTTFMVIIITSEEADRYNGGGAVHGKE